MAERKAQNKWIPPNFDPQKHKSINGYHNSHPLRERARKLHEGIVIIRFEMPYNVWCLHCNSHIGVGVRYNAQKKRIGNYLSTPIFEFRMKCHVCSGWIAMQTDPKNMQYLCMDGLRRKVEEYEAGAETRQIELQSDEVKEKLESNPFYRLEHGNKDKEKQADSAKIIEDLYELNDRHWRDPYEQSKKLRNILRSGNKEQRAKNHVLNGLKDKYSLDIPVLPPTETDMMETHNYSFESEDLAERANERILAELEASIFPTSSHNGDLSRNELFKTELKRTKIVDALVSSTPKADLIIKKKVKNEKQEKSRPSLVSNYSDSDDE